MSTAALPEVLGQRYRLVERLATGGMGVVWRAVDERLGREVAIKLIRPEYADDATFRQRLSWEAKAIAAVRSPHVVRIHDACEEPDPAGGCRSFLVMELADGEPLSSRLQSGALTPKHVAGVLSRAAEGLAAAHARDIVHRDVKPANIMVGAFGGVTVLDFGIARAADGVSLTEPGMVLGTSRYLAPEQVGGGAATPASDVYALGVVAYECLTGRPPFEADSDVAVALAHRDDPVPPLPAWLPVALTDLVTRMLAKAPAERPSAADVAGEAADIERRLPAGAAAASRAAVDSPVTAGTQPPTAPAQPVTRNDSSAGWRPLPLAVVGAVALLVLVVPLWFAAGSGRPASNAAASTTRRPVAAAGHGASARSPADTVAVVDSRYRGEKWSLARRQLRALGLHPHMRLSDRGAAGRVLRLSRAGTIARGGSVVVTVGRGATPSRHAGTRHHPSASRHGRRPAAPPRPPGHRGQPPPGAGHGKGG